MADRQKIVILEDDEMFAALLAETLGEYFDVEVGYNGLQGIALCLEGGVAAVVTDISMPDLDGLQMLTEFNKNPRLSAIPVMVVTTADFSLEAERFPQVRGVFSKSKSVEFIVEAVRQELHPV